jgi:HPt (histidine-containing phosphotransfer) domain-containing protein
MSVEQDSALEVLRANPLKDVDFIDGLNRFGGQPAIYLRILKVFVKSTPALLESLASVTPETIADYTISVHGLKGSCYSISAMALGDEAKELEFASRAFDWERVERDTPLLIDHVNAVIDQLEEVIETIEPLLS